MKKQPFESHTLHEPNIALRHYLDALLCETTFAVEAEDELFAQEDVNSSTAVDSVQQGTELQDVSAKAGDVADSSHKSDADRISPDWAQGQFQCLSFEVAGVMLAAPLETLDGIVELMGETITELPGYSPWVVGLIPNRGKNVQVVDIAEIIIPEDRRSGFKPASERMKYLVLIDGGRFGLVADSISEVLTLDATEVRWRRTDSRRPWLAGTVVGEMCALLEIEQLRSQLQSGLKDAC